MDSLLKLNPRNMMGNPVMFVVEIGSVITTVLSDPASAAGAFRFNLQITLWLWFTVLFANFAEAMAEGRGKAQADTLRKRALGNHGQSHRYRRQDRRNSQLQAARRRLSCLFPPANSFPATARSSKASPRWTSPRSPANLRQ